MKPARSSARTSSRPASSPKSPVRLPRLDALRGAALLWMAGFHACFDLAYFGWLQADFYRDPFWTTQRTLIVSLFLLCAGLGQALAHAQQIGWPRFWQRWAQIAGCALLVSLGSWFMFPGSFITFGVLHGMALMLLLLRWAGPRLQPWHCAGLGLLAVLLPQFVQHPFFDTRWTNWLGLVTHKPITEDYVPLLPWLGVMLWGYGLGRWLLARSSGKRAAPLLGGTLPKGLAPLALLGRWSLSFYMLHQPVLIGGMLLVQAALAA
jgi:uncharacterized membrane protein